MFIIHTYNTTKKSKRKFKSAAEKASYLAAMESEYGVAKKRKVVESKTESLFGRPYIRETTHYPSRGDGIGTATKAPQKVYTGTKLMGIGTLHKSNAVPVFSDEEAKDLATMRR